MSQCIISVWQFVPFPIQKCRAKSSNLDLTVSSCKSWFLVCIPFLFCRIFLNSFLIKRSKTWNDDFGITRLRLWWLAYQCLLVFVCREVHYFVCGLITSSSWCGMLANGWLLSDDTSTWYCKDLLRGPVSVW